jgi:hypothetical protein
MRLPASVHHLLRLLCLLPHSFSLSLYYIVFSQCYPTEICVFTMLIHLVLLLLPSLAHIVLDTFIAKLDAPDTCKRCMLMLFMQMDSDHRWKIHPHRFRRIRPCSNVHLQMSPGTPMNRSTTSRVLFHPTSRHHLLLHTGTWILMLPTSIGITHRQGPIPTSNRNYTDTLHLEITQGVSMFLNLHVLLDHIIAR